MSDGPLVLFLGGDVMTGRGIDQILPHPGDPQLREQRVRDARVYVQLAERVNGPIYAPVDMSWPWGDVLEVLDDAAPDVRVINLETSITTSGDFAPGKGIHYRMHPGNLACLQAASPDACALANNHVLDFGRTGLLETVQVLAGSGLRPVGAGDCLEQAQQPAIIPVGDGSCRIVVSSLGTPSSGIPPTWAAEDHLPGVDVVAELSDAAADDVTGRLAAVKRPGDVVVASVHWGSNWGYDVPADQVRFAHRLVDGGVDVVHGHSSHHPRPAEVYRDRLILYGCGDLINDYEGIQGYEDLRADLRLVYLVHLDRDTGRLARLVMAPMQARRLRLHHATPSDARWLADTMTRAGSPFGSHIERDPDGRLTLRWGESVA